MPLAITITLCATCDGDPESRRKLRSLAERIGRVPSGEYEAVSDADLVRYVLDSRSVELAECGVTITASSATAEAAEPSRAPLVVWHEHAFPPGTDLDDPDTDEVTGRYDALEYSDGRIAVWSAASKSVVSTHATRAEAIAEATHLAAGG